MFTINANTPGVRAYMDARINATRALAQALVDATDLTSEAKRVAFHDECNHKMKNSTSSSEEIEYARACRYLVANLM